MRVLGGWERGSLPRRKQRRASLERLRVDAVLQALDAVVQGGGGGCASFLDTSPPVLQRVGGAEVRAEATPELAKRVAEVEARKARVGRRADERLQERPLTPRLHVGARGHLHEPDERLRGCGASQDVDHLGRDFECGLFEAQVAARRDAEEESKIDVNQMPCPVNENVSVVPILDPERVANHRVGGHGALKVALRRLERCLVRPPVPRSEQVVD
mmetsp:Transcript_3956/g.16496  ORF Transcript_3956/g.16496 Transcript_3956/m.16496 type:complete len:215 (-) Transcript_3956:1146-1790(-)